MTAMPLRFQISHPDRMVVGVAEGPVTLQDLIAFLQEIDRNRASSYRKIIDLMGGTAALSEAELAAFSEHYRSLPSERKQGAIALVSAAQHEPLARLFAEQTGGERPAGVFANIHDARKWLKGDPQ